MFIAGSGAAWDALPRDVTPRLRQREPLPVGNLSADETESLLDSYIRAAKSGARFSVSSMERIHELSGGNPRETLRIAYHAFNKARGELKKVNDSLLIECAKEAGSIADRNRLALEQAESELKPLGILIRDLEVEDGVLIDFLLLVNQVPVLALLTAKATDKLSEVDSARRIQAARDYLRIRYPAAQLIVVSVGYSSSEVQNLLRATSTVIQYDERQFAHQLKTKVTEIIAQARFYPSESVTDNSAILKAVNNIASRLDQLELKRSKEMDEAAEQFSDEAHKLNRPVREEREMRTRWEVRDALDELEEVLLGGLKEWRRGPWREARWEEERQRIKSILVASEANLHVNHFDYVGGLYQDLLMEERGFWKELDKLEAKQLSSSKTIDVTFLDFSNIPQEKRQKDPRWILSELLSLRLEFIKIMRRLLQGPRLLEKWVEKPWHYALLPTGVVTIPWLITLTSALDSYGLRMEIERLGLWGFFFVRVFSVFILTYGTSAALLFFMGKMRTQAWEAKAGRIRRLIRNYDKPSM